MAGGTNYDVFLVAGQSNMDGRGRVSELTNTLAKWREPQLDVQIVYVNPKFASVPDSSPNKPAWRPLGPGFSVPPRFSGPLPSGAFGPELSFARALADNIPTQRVALIKVTEGGTSITKHWNPNQGRLYASLTNAVDEALLELRANGNNATLRGMIWHQGEADVVGGGLLYATNLSAFITRIRTDLNAPRLPFVLGEIATNQPIEFRRAQASVTNLVENAAFVSAAGLVASDGLHFKTADVLELGRRYASAMKPLLRSASAALP